MIELRGITWDHPRGVGGLRAASDAYALRHPGVSVAWDVRSLRAFGDRPAEELADAFDLVVLDHPSIGRAVAADAFVPLDEHVERSVLDERAASSVGRSAESYRWEGRPWAMAVDAAAQVAAFRPDLLEEAGATVPRRWDEVAELARTVRSRGRWIAFAALPVDVFCAVCAICAGLGEEPFAGDVVASRSVGIEALETLRMVLVLAHPSSLGSDPPRTLEAMAAGDEIVYVPLAFGYVNHATAGPGSRALRFSGGPAGPDGTPRGTLGGAGLAISARSRHVEQACAFAAFVTSGEIQRTVYVSGGGQPGHQDAWTDPGVNAAHGGFFRDTLAALDAAYLRPRFDGFLGFQERAGELVHRWLSDRAGARPAGDVLDELDTAFRASRLAPRSGVGR